MEQFINVQEGEIVFYSNVYSVNKYGIVLFNSLGHKDLKKKKKLIL